MAKLFRYRRPSLNTVLGITRAKKKLNKELGITAAMKPLRWWGNEKRKVKRDLGYYSPLGRLLRLGSPRFMGMGAAPRPRTGSPVAVLVALAVVVIALGSVFGGCDVKREPAVERAASIAPVAPNVREPVMVAYRPTPIAAPAIDIPEPQADHDLAEPPKAPKARDWTDRSGKFHTSAVLLDVVDGHAQLQKPDKLAVQR